MVTKFSARLCIAVAAAGTMSGTAFADMVAQGGGDINGAIMYRAYAFGSVNFGNDGGVINGVDYVSNFAPLPVATASVNSTVHGATLTSFGQSAYSGFYAGRNYASISVANANSADSYYQVAGQGSTTSVQFFDASAAAAYATFSWRAGGTESNLSNLPPTLGGVGPATGRLDFGASTDADVHWTDLFEEDLSQSSSGGKLNSIRQFGPGTFVYNLPIVSLGTAINLFYWSSAFTEVDAGQTTETNYSLTANYYNTFELESVQLFDIDNNPISDWSLMDITQGKIVFDQDGRVEPISEAPPFVTEPPELVPEPATLALVGLGLAGVFFSRRKQKSN